jgi:large subunit ribosomal protein L25
MAETNTLAAERRERAGKGPARSSRRAGRVPGILYGEQQEPVMISVEPRALERAVNKPGFFATLFDLQLDGKTLRVLPRDVQLDPINDKPIHFDLMRVGAGSRVHVAVPVVFQNELLSPGLKRGGVLNVVRHEVEIVCAPDLIPHEIVVDLTGKEIGDSVHISAVNLPEGVTPTITDRDFTLATIAAPTVVKADAEAAAAAAATGEAAAPTTAAAAPAAPEKKS